MDKAVDRRTIRLPSTLVADCAGLALDIGGSLAKLIYRTEDQYIDAARNKENGGFSRVQCVTYRYDDIQAILHDIHINAHFDNTRDIPCTGLYVQSNRDVIEKTLNIKLCRQYELDNLVRGFMFSVRCLAWSDVMTSQCGEPLLDSIMQITAKINAKFVRLHEEGTLTYKCHPLGSAYATANEYPNLGFGGPPAQMFPCIVAMCGSLHCFQLVHEDGTYEAFDLDYMGGKTLLGMSSLLLGTDDFEEIMGMGSTGDRNNVDITDNENTYFTSLEARADVSTFFEPFAKCVGKKIGDVNSADVARSLVNTFVVSLVASLRAAAVGSGVSHVFLSGSFTSHPRMRKLLAGEIIRREAMTYTFQGKHTNATFHFMQNGAYTNVLGCLL